MDLCLHPNSETVPIVYFAWMILANIGSNNPPYDASITTAIKEHGAPSKENVNYLIRHMPRGSLESLNSFILSEWSTQELKQVGTSQPWKFYLNQLKELPKRFSEWGKEWKQFGTWDHLECGLALNELLKRSDEFPEEAQFVESKIKLLLGALKCKGFTFTYELFTAGYADYAIPLLGSLGLPREDIVKAIQSYTPFELNIHARLQRAVALVQLGVKDESLAEVFVQVQTAATNMNMFWTQAYDEAAINLAK